MINNEKTKQIASAVAYKDGTEAPVVICNGKALIAEQMIQIAHENDIPVVYEPITARILSICKDGEYIPRDVWNILAGIFIFIRGQSERSTENKK